MKPLFSFGAQLRGTRKEFEDLFSLTERADSSPRISDEEICGIDIVRAYVLEAICEDSGSKDGPPAPDEEVYATVLDFFGASPAWNSKQLARAIVTLDTMIVRLQLKDDERKLLQAVKTSLVRTLKTDLLVKGLA